MTEHNFIFSILFIVLLIGDNSGIVFPSVSTVNDFSYTAGLWQGWCLILQLD